MSQVPQEAVLKDDFCYCKRPWNINYKDYQALLNESEYAAWLAAFGFIPKHFTVSINHLDSLSEIAEVNKFLKQNGFILNSSGGEIKGSPEDLLEQSSTVARPVKVEFADGVHSVPGCYYEFAKRYNDENGVLFQGFVAKSADKIFESTDVAAG